MKRILFVCLENKARSQIAEALFNKLAEEKGVLWRAMSAGTVPALEVYAETKKVLEEEGIDFKGRPKLLTEEILTKADRVITMGCGVSEACPVVFSSEDWKLPDPKGKSLEEFRKLKDEIKKRVEVLLENLAKVK